MPKSTFNRIRQKKQCLTTGTVTFIHPLLPPFNSYVINFILDCYIHDVYLYYCITEKNKLTRKCVHSMLEQVVYLHLFKTATSRCLFSSLEQVTTNNERSPWSTSMFTRWRHFIFGYEIHSVGVNCLV